METNGARMKLIKGGGSKSFIHGEIRIVVDDSSRRPFSVDVMIFEEDTNLVLTLDKVVVYQVVMH